MVQLKKLTMTLVLLMTAATGAWAQTAFGVKEVTADMVPSSWQGDQTAITAADLPGFVPVKDVDVARTWTGAPSEYTTLLYDLDGSIFYEVNYNGGNEESSGAGGYSRSNFYYRINGNMRIFYTTAPAGPAVTPTGNANEWSLTMPAGNVLLNVAYKDRTSTTVLFGQQEITSQANAVTGYRGFEEAFAEQIAATVQNIEPTFNQG